MKKKILELQKYVGAVNYVDGHRGCFELYDKDTKVGVKLYKSNISGSQYTPFYTAQYISEAAWLADNHIRRYSGDALDFFANPEGKLFGGPARSALIKTIAQMRKNEQEELVNA